jgi:hypothetical protein
MNAGQVEGKQSVKVPEATILRKLRPITLLVLIDEVLNERADLLSKLPKRGQNSQFVVPDRTPERFSQEEDNTKRLFWE